ncbi:monocarboxylate transporter 14 [Nilaparvata lugens]|uniref:monocarboxylate transporter 14 n=1 Tax=Nilaparvata lugens TaxID=108931 RepID=UPI00193D2A86|nr:monocarboxylate transporter 14 [Nilaparvata lugens]XP_039290597.1 monocarboxylate transporter 14 [Nilaparvata lugens]XP_039290598.1 monocarboxylate transporter 14 [Nilaparvata lugens]
MEPKASLNENRNGLAPIVRWSSMTSSVDSSMGVSPAKSLTSSGIVPDTASNRPSEDGSNAEEPQLFPSTSTAMSTGSDDDRENNNRLHRRKKSPVDSDGDAATVLTVPNNDEGVKFDLPEADSIMSSTSSLCETRKSLKKPEPNIPDGGWGWMVVLSSFFISMIADGISFSFGLLYIRFLKHFGATKSATSWIGSLFMAVPLLSGPIGSALVDRYGCRWMTIIGGIISCIGFLLSSLCDSIITMYLTFGVIAGLGLGLGYVTAVVSIAPWFDKRRVLATGLGACGTGVGTVVYAPMTQYFIDEYGWRGTVIMLAGTFFNMCVCGALMRDPEWWVQEQQQQQLQKSNRGSSCTSLVTTADLQALEEVRLMLKAGESPDYVLTQLATSIKAPEDEECVEAGPDKLVSPNVQSVYNLPTFVRQNEKVPLEVLEALRANKRMYNVIVENYPSLLSCRSMSDNKLNKMAVEPVRAPVTMRISSAQNKVKPVMEPHMEPLLPPVVVPEPKMKSVSPPKDYVFKKKQSIMDNHHYLKNIRIHRNSIMYRGATLNTRNYRLKASSCPDIYRNSMTTLARETEENWRSELMQLLLEIMDFSMFLELHFMLMSLGTILLFTWFIVPYFYLADFMTRHNYTENDGSFVLSVIGGTNTVGMVALGWLGDRPWVDVATAYSICLTICGLATCAIPLCIDNYYLLLTASGVFGLTFASNFSFTPPITVKLISLERFTSAYGLILLCQGIGNLLGPPLGGAVFDLTGSWDLAFYLAGILILISGLLICLIPMTRNRVIYGSGTLERDKDSNSIA